MKEQQPKPLCTECLHARGKFAEYLKCAYSLSPVNGLAASFCVHEREPRKGCCGPSGQFFEPRPAPKRSRLIAWLRKVW